MYEYKSELVRCIDGDTVICKIDLGFRISIVETFRLAGINTPEPRGATAASGKAATAHLETLIAADLPIIIRTQKDRKGKYGRWIATLYGHSGFSLNTLMVRHGYAEAVDYE